MTLLVLATALFAGIHLLVSGTALRGAIVGMIGERPYLGLFSLVSLLGLAGMIWGYVEADYVELWLLPGLAWIPILAMPAALILAIGAFTAPNPTLIGSERAAERADPIRGVAAITRHPFLWAVALWAAAHLSVNGDSASVVFFGGLLAVALIGPSLIDAKRQRGDEEAWRRVAAGSSALPFLALVQGRARLRFADVGWWRLALAAALYLALLLAHGDLLGVSALPL